MAKTVMEKFKDLLSDFESDAERVGAAEREDLTGHDLEDAEEEIEYSRQALIDFFTLHGGSNV